MESPATRCDLGLAKVYPSDDDPIEPMLSRTSQLASRRAAAMGAVRSKSTAPAFKSGTWIDKELGYST